MAINDGLDALRAQLDLASIMKLIENTAQWVDRETFDYLPVWYPEEARKDLMYKSNWSEPLYNTNKQTGETIHKRAGNGSANKALTFSLGLRQNERPNWSCCHIWSIDDSSFQRSNLIASDKRYYSCVGNMVLLPTPLKAFTDVMQEVRDMLRIVAAHYYSWAPDYADVPTLSELEASCCWDSYPSTWPTRKDSFGPSGVVKFNERIRKSADRRKAAIRKLVNESGNHYPREQVINVLNYWNVEL